LQPADARCCLKVFVFVGGELKGLSEIQQGGRMRASVHTALKIADCPRTQPRTRGKPFLRESSEYAVSSQ
jgi:hypothetical protein